MKRINFMPWFRVMIIQMEGSTAGEVALLAIVQVVFHEKKKQQQVTVVWKRRLRGPVVIEDEVQWCR